MKLKEFSVEDGEALESGGWVVRNLRGISIAQIRAESAVFDTDWYLNYPFEYETAEATQAGFNPEISILPGTPGLDLGQMEARLIIFAKCESKRLGLRAVEFKTGLACVYAEILGGYFRDTGIRLLPAQYTITRTRTHREGFGSQNMVAAVGRYTKGGICISEVYRDEGEGDVGLMPLVFPK